MLSLDFVRISTSNSLGEEVMVPMTLTKTRFRYGENILAKK